MAKNKGKSKSFNTNIMIAIAAGIVALITVYMYNQIFSQATIIVPKKSGPKTIEAFTEIKEGDFEKVSISKMDLKYFNDVATSFTDIKDKVPLTPLQAGIPIKKADFINLKDPNALASTITSADGRETLIYLNAPMALNGGFQAGSTVDLYIIVEDTKTKEVMIAPVKNQLKVKGKITLKDGFYIRAETNDILSEQFLLAQYMVMEKQNATFAIMLPGMNPTDYKGKVYKWSDFMTTLQKTTIEQGGAQGTAPAADASGTAGTAAKPAEKTDTTKKP